MARSVILLVIGAVAGGAAVSFYDALTRDTAQPASLAGEPARPATAATSPADIDLPPAAAAAVEGNRVSERVALYERVAEARDSFDLEGMIDLAAARPGSIERDLELETLLARLAELDPSRAVAIAQSLYLEPRFLEPLYKAWALADADAAIAAVAAIPSPATRRKMALALLDVVGYDASGVALIAASLPEAEKPAFEVDAIIRRAESDPLGALQAALGLSRSTMQQTVLLRIAESAGRVDPLGALAQAESISDPQLRQIFSGYVLNAWAELDPGAAFALIESSGFDSYEASANMFATLAKYDPERLLALAETLPTQIRSNAQRAVLTSMAESDPIGALSMLEALIPPGADRNSALQSIAMAWGADDPDAALAWAQSLNPPSQDALTAVLQGVARVDFDRAVDAVIAEAQRQPAAPGLPGVNSVQSLLSSMGFTMIFALNPPGDTQFDRIADRLAELDQPIAQNMLRSVISRWSSEDADSALNWAIANADRIDPNALRTMASTAARENPDLAIQTVGRIPIEQRQGWIQGVMTGLVTSDVDRAIEFISQYRGQPAYENSMLTVVLQVARSDPRRAANLIAESGSSQQLMAASAMLASQWAQQDPRAALEYANSIEDQRTQTQAMQQIASAWAQNDADAARTWLRDMPQGDNRDAAISGYLGSMAQLGDIEEGLLDAYSSDMAKQQGLMNVIAMLGRTDMDEAKRLLDTHITDSRMRLQAEEMLLRSSPAGIVPSGGIVIF